jgi:integrase
MTQPDEALPPREDGDRSGINDPRLIMADTPIWQPLSKSGGICTVGTNSYNPARGMSSSGLANIIKRRSAAVLGKDNALQAHDCRRTAAALAYEAGMPLTDIQQLLRHKSAAVTLHYVGTKPDYDRRRLSAYIGDLG